MATSFISNYKAKHQHPLNRLSHSVGIPLIVISLPLFLLNWRWALELFIAGWILQYLGHLIEGNQPAFFTNPVYLLVGPWWLLRRALGLSSAEPRGTMRRPL
jgi:uncharacterized membrane protein YGL010W